MFHLRNFTCFHAQNFVSVDQTDRGYHVILAKIGYTFNIDAYTGQAELTLSSVQPPLVFSDHYNSDSALSSTLIESDFVLYKPKLDVIINAMAYAPMGRAAAYFPASVMVGNYQKDLLITGPRYWRRESFGWSLTDASPIECLPIRYEYAFGGTGSNLLYGDTSDDLDDDNHITEETAILHNPIGQGFYSEAYLKDVPHRRTFSAHQIDSPTHPVLHPSESRLPQGFGWFSRYFASRLAFSGTMDIIWMQNRAPLLPGNFSMEYWNGAHPDLQFAHLKHNHLYDFVFTGLVPYPISPKQTFRLQLPVETFFVQLYTTKNLSICRDLILDTIRIDVEERRIECTYRRAFAEEMGIETAELRYIARNERGAQIEIAREMQEQKKISQDAQLYYIPLPPSLLSTE